MIRWTPLVLAAAIACTSIQVYPGSDKGEVDPTDEPTDVEETDITDTTEDTAVIDTGHTAPTLLISEVVDHATVSQIKYVELYNPGSAPISLFGWSVARYANGSSAGDSEELPDIELPGGGVYVIASNLNGESAFISTYGTAADLFSGIITGNGNDAYALLYFDEVIDVFGEIGVDGNGEAWDYEDSVARRDTSIDAPNAIWTASEWIIIPGSETATPFLRD